jgi:hypothetical protein
MLLMRKYALQCWLGLGLLFGQIGLIILLICLTFGVKGFDFPDFTTTLALVVPMFATQLTAALRFFFREEAEASRVSTASVSGPVVVISVTIPLVTLISVAIAMFAKSYGHLSFDQFKILLGSSQSVLGGYLGFVYVQMFGADARTPVEPKSTDKPNPGVS